MRLKLIDTSGNNHHARLYEMPKDRWVPTFKENAISMDGISDYAETYASNIGQGATELTFSAWINPASQGDWHGIISGRGIGDNQLFSINSAGYTPNAIEFRAMNANIDSPENSIPMNRWSHVAAVWKSGQIQDLYINGKLAASNGSPRSGSVEIDNDTLIDRHEYRAGTIANSSGSLLQLQQFSPHQLEWQSVPGKTYRIWYTDDLTDDTWNILQENINATDAITSLPLAPGSKAIFYRIELQE